MNATAKTSELWKVGLLAGMQHGWVRKYGVPYVISTVATFVTANVMEALKVGDLVAISLEWLAENGGFYGMALLCGTFSDSRPARGRGPLQRILAAEGLDTMVRSLLLFVARQLPIEHRAWGAAIAGVLADMSFCILLAHSQRLLGMPGMLLDRVAFRPSGKC